MKNIERYWSGLDKKLPELLKNGFVKLPSLKNFELNKVANKISREMNSLTFSELTYSHKKFLDYIQIQKYLTPVLYELAKKNFDYNGSISNQYHIARKVVPGNMLEQYRAHFDSHLFTLIMPIKIPINFINGHNGELIYFSKIRNMPKNELNNLIGKIYFKTFASKKGLDKLLIKYDKKIDNFLDYQPLLFIGKTTLHTNYPVPLDCSSYRLTLLSHFFDNSPKYGIGNLLRFIRNR